MENVSDVIDIKNVADVESNNDIKDLKEIDNIPGNRMAVNNIWEDKDSMNHAWKSATMLAKSDVVPTSYQGKPENCFIALGIAIRSGLEPVVVMQNLYIVRGKPNWSGQACNMLINNSGRYKVIKPVYFGDKGSPNRGCYLLCRDNDGEDVEGPDVTIAMAKAEGWGSKWKTMPEIMLAYRASTFFARVYCPEVLFGFRTMGEHEDISNNKAKQPVNDPLA